MEEVTTTAAAPAAETATDAAPAKKTSKREQNAADAVAALRARYARAKAKEDAQDAPPAAEPKPSAPAANVEKAAGALEAAGGEVPDQKANETDSQYERRLAKALRELRDAQQESRKIKADHEVTVKELDKLKSLVERGKLNPLEFLDHIGMSFDDLVAAINDDRVKKPVKKAPIDPEIQAEIEQLRADRLAREAEKKEAADRAAFQQNVSKVSAYLRENDDRFPLVASLKGSAEAVIRNAIAANSNNFIPVLEQMEAALVDDAIGLVGSERALMAALKKDGSLKAKILKALGVSQEQEPTIKPSTQSLSSIPTEAPARSGQKLTKAEKTARALALWKAKQANDSDDDF